MKKTLFFAFMLGFLFQACQQEKQINQTAHFDIAELKTFTTELLNTREKLLEYDADNQIIIPIVKAGFADQQLADLYIEKILKMKERWKSPYLYNDNVSYEVVEIMPINPEKGIYKVLGLIKRPNIQSNCSNCEIVTTEGRKEYEITYVKIDGQLKIANMTHHFDSLFGDDY